MYVRRLAKMLSRYLEATGEFKIIIYDADSKQMEPVTGMVTDYENKTVELHSDLIQDKQKY